MSPAILLRFFFAEICWRLGIVARRLCRHTASDLLILAYHRITSRNRRREYIQSGMYVSPETFRRQIRFLKKRFRIIPLQELPRYLYGEVERDIPKPVCILTFDDGWYDFHEAAYPTLKEYQVPATVFLPTDYIGTKRWFWTDYIAQQLRERPLSTPSFRGNRAKKDAVIAEIEALSGRMETQIETAIMRLKTLHQDRIEEILKELSEKWETEPVFPGRAFLSWDEVRGMRRSGLITFGSHTASHRILTTLTADDVLDELVSSKKTLISKEAVSQSFIPFCYPNGNYDERIVGMVREAGYDLAVTTRMGWNQAKSSPFTLRRVSIHQDITSTAAMFGCRVSGIY